MGTSALPRARIRLRPVWLAAAVVAVAVLIGAVALMLSRLHPVTGIEASGTIEATESDLSPKVQGRLVDLRVHDGDQVRKGEVLAVLERVDPGLNLVQARANVATARAGVEAAQAAYRLQQSTYATTLAQAGAGISAAESGVGQAGESLGLEQRGTALAVDQARAQLAAAQAAYVHARINLGRSRSLVGTGDLPRQSLDDAVNAFAGAVAGRKAATDALASAESDRRNVVIRRLAVDASRAQRLQAVAAFEAAEAGRELVAQRYAQVLTARGQLAQAQAALGLAQDQVRETVLVAPFDGYVVSHNFEVGALVQPGSAAMTIGDLSHPYLYVYVSETDLPHVKAGMPADATIDGLPNRTFGGRVTEISNTAEFTPENVQTKADRIEYLVFRVKIQFSDETGSLKPGLPADAVIR